MATEHHLDRLAQQASAGDVASLAELIEELQPAVVRVTRLIVGPGSWAAEDAAQDALVDISQGIGTLREPAAVRAWALKVAVSRALKVAKQERLRAFKVSLYEAPELPDVRQSEVYAGELKDAFYGLPPRMRAVAILRLYAGLSEAETAQALGTSVGTVKSQLHEARARLGRRLGGQT